MAEWKPGDEATVRREPVRVLGPRHEGFRGLGATTPGADVLVEYSDGETGAVRASDIEPVSDAHSN